MSLLRTCGTLTATSRIADGPTRVSATAKSAPVTRSSCCPGAAPPAPAVTTRLHPASGSQQRAAAM
jgi:hypothetical protein